MSNFYCHFRELAVVLCSLSTMEAAAKGEEPVSHEDVKEQKPPIKVIDMAEESKKIQRIHPIIGQSLPEPVRRFLFGPVAFASVSFFCTLFYVMPGLFLYAVYSILFNDIIVGICILCLIFFFAYWPAEHNGKPNDKFYSVEWPSFRRLCSAWFDLFSLSHSVNPIASFEPDKQYIVYGAQKNSPRKKYSAYFIYRM